MEVLLVMPRAVIAFARRAKVTRAAIAFAVTVGVVLIECAAPAFAGSTGLAAMDSGQTTAVTFLGGLAGTATIALVALGIWDFVQHKNFIRAGFELVAVVICGIVATHSSETAQLFGISGALL
jgi:hypothetical protein